jgi:hypothetical protein
MGRRFHLFGHAVQGTADSGTAGVGKNTEPILVRIDDKSAGLRLIENIFEPVPTFQPRAELGGQGKNTDDAPHLSRTDRDLVLRATAGVGTVASRTTVMHRRNCAQIDSNVLQPSHIIFPYRPPLQIDGTVLAIPSTVWPISL